MKNILVLFAIVLVLSGYSQGLQVTNIQIDSEGIVSFTAQVTSKKSNRERYELTVSSSVDNYQHGYTLEGEELIPGQIHDMVFNGNLLVGEYTGSIQFRFDISATVFPVEVSEDTDSGLKIGKEYTVSWNDFHSSGTYKIELLRNGTTYQILQRSYAGTSYTDILPSSIEKGDYDIRVTPVNNSDLASEPYVVSVKTAASPLIKFGLPGVALLGGAAAVLLSGDDGGSPGTDDGSDFPDTPSLPGGG